MSSSLPRVGEKRFDVLAAVVDHCSKARFGPTLDELAETVGLTSRSSAHFHVLRLLEDELVVHIPQKHRSLKPTVKGRRLVEILRGEASG